MDRYQRVEKPKAETPINENEIRITTQGRMRNYISYATALLQEKGSSEIVLKAMGRAINKTVMIAELIKRRIVGLHQNTCIGSTDITDTWEPLEEGLLPLETTRHVSMITITLSKKELDTSSPGYQPPIPIEQVKPINEIADDGGNNDMDSPFLLLKLFALVTIMAVIVGMMSTIMEEEGEAAQEVVVSSEGEGVVEEEGEATVVVSKEEGTMTTMVNLKPMYPKFVGVDVEGGGDVDVVVVVVATQDSMVQSKHQQPEVDTVTSSPM
ncbi:unnamed protein product [Linum tenue]|uniref:DNA/RNA-binding protein Alba-like domain-containing protein n=1 Tax=Linum tenue TaxID=586396 RepID=A0AAV0L0T7_9ROSI|nr:unnamed protein product [Linum tenue]